MTRRTRVYVAGPITSSGYFLDNIHQAVQLSNILLHRGYAPYCPHVNCFWEIVIGGEDYELWMELDTAFLSACDVLLRMPGESKGADREVVQAMTRKLPVYLSLDTLVACVPPTRPA